MRDRRNFFPEDLCLKGLFLGLCVFIALEYPTWAQTSKAPATAASYSEAYCSGFIGKTEMPHAGRVLAAYEGKTKNDLSVGDLVFLGDGPVANLERGQEVFVVRPVRKARELGTVYLDIGHVKIVDVHEGVRVGRIDFSCQPMGVDDWVVAPQERVLPAARRDVPFDRFAPPTGKANGQIVDSRDNLVQLGQGVIIYLNVGANQGVQPGSTLRIFRPTSEASANAYNRGKVKKYAKKLQLPRQVTGECVVLQAGENSSTAIITYSLEEMVVGDWVELE